MASKYGFLFLTGFALVLCGCAHVERQAQSDEAPLEVQAASPVGTRLVQDGFAIVDFRALRDQYSQVYVVGEVKNVSESARGVELQATLRDADGRVVSVGNFYPASNHNIAPGEVWPFSYAFGRQGGGVETELRIVGTFHTIETVGIVR